MDKLKFMQIWPRNGFVVVKGVERLFAGFSQGTRNTTVGAF
jgi:hypothetical protein